jgi:hypothetical protein
VALQEVDFHKHFVVQTLIFLNFNPFLSMNHSLEVDWISFQVELILDSLMKHTIKRS